MNSQLSFNNISLNTIEKDGQIWITSSELATALDYADTSGVTRIYNRYYDEFSESMTQTVKMTVSGNYQKIVRYFSLRGCHLIAMFAKTKIAKEFRKWVLDILDKLCNSTQQLPVQKSRLANAPENLNSSRSFALALMTNGSRKHDEVKQAYSLMRDKLLKVIDGVREVERMINYISQNDGAVHDGFAEARIYLFMDDDIRKNSIPIADKMFKPLDFTNV